MHDAVDTWQPKIEKESSGFGTALAVVVIVALTGLAYHLGHSYFLPKAPEAVPAAAEDVVPCDVKLANDELKRFEYGGPGYLHRKGGVIMTHCKPCEKARSKEEKFVCDGDQG